MKITERLSGILDTAQTVAAGDGSNRAFTYDRADRLTRLQDTRADTTIILDDTYTLDNADNPTAITHAGGSVDTYTYDTLDRLTGICYATTNCATATDYVKWAYDAVGNRLTEIRPNGTTTSTHDPATGQLTKTTAPGGAVTNYSYDALGQMTTAGGATYGYNAAGRMTSATSGGTTTTYTYDGDGRRLTASTGATTNRFLWEPRSYKLAAETDTTNTRIRDYAYGLGPIATIGPTGAPSYLHTDIQGSVREVTTATGNPLWQYAYEPFGVIRQATNVTGTAPANPLQFAGQYTEVSGQSHLRARQYDPTIGAFTSPDPAGATNISATYTYANSNPMTAGDPYGLWPDPGDMWDGVTSAATATWDGASSAASYAWDGATSAASWTRDHHRELIPVTAAYDAIGNAVTVCTSGKGSCGSAVFDAAIATAGCIPIPGTAVAAKGLRIARAGRAAKTADEFANVGFRSNTSHIFRNATGHLAEDTAENRALIQSALDPANLRTTITLKDGSTLAKYYKTLPDGTQAWVELRNGTEITNGGINVIPR